MRSLHCGDRDVFDRRIECLVRAVLSDTPCFHTLIAGLPAVYPTTALAAAERLAERGQISAAMLAALRHSAREGLADTPTRSILPLPHPLDFEWRFTADSSRVLLDLASDLAPAGGPILLFGTPGIALEALSLPTEHPLMFLGEDNAVTRRLAAVNAAGGAPLQIFRCAEGLPSIRAAAVILDPPWYMDFVRPMMAAAAASIQTGGFLLASLPPEGVRAGATEDRRRVLRLASRLGLELIAEPSLAVRYDTPFFEANALAAAGLRVIHPWRCGDLVIFRKRTELPRSVSTASIRKARWSEVEIGRMRLFVRRDLPTGTGHHGLIPLVKGDVLPSVSRRDPRRRLASIWTTGNRLFASDNPELVVEAALTLAGARLGSGLQSLFCSTISERHALERIADTLRNMAATEAGEERAGRPIMAANGSEACRLRLPVSRSGFPITISGSTISVAPQNP
jgi:hypothetical protein